MTKRPIDIKELFDIYQFKGDPADKDDVHAFLMTETSKGLFKKEHVFSKCFPELYKDIMSAEICTNKSFSERLFIYFNPHATGLCKVCRRPTKFRNFKSGYPIYCSSKCCNADPDKKESCRQTVINRYGVDNVFKSSVVKDRICNTFKEKYGVEWVGQSKDVQAKQKATCMAKYGVYLRDWMVSDDPSFDLFFSSTCKNPISSNINLRPHTYDELCNLHRRYIDRQGVLKKDTKEPFRIMHITQLTDDCYRYSVSLLNCNKKAWVTVSENELLEQYTWSDGKPCGVKRGRR